MRPNATGYNFINARGTVTMSNGVVTGITCNSGYSGDGITCTNVDECNDGSNTCDVNAACADHDGGYTCTCNNGYSGDGVSCFDVDECAANTDNCDVNAFCSNVVGSFNCNVTTATPETVLFVQTLMTRQDGIDLKTIQWTQH